MPISELRIDPIVGRRVYIAEDRAGRPNDYSAGNSKKSHASSESCPFCYGHEEQTPEALHEVYDANGHWTVRVVPNKYPAVKLDASMPNSLESDSSLEARQAPIGSHEVIIESPRHLHDVTEMAQDEFAKVLQVYRDRIRAWSEDSQIQHVLIFKNVGPAAGASLEHAHSQLLALPYVPPVVQEELRGAKDYFTEHGKCVFSQLIEEEIREGVRLISDEGPFVAISAYAGRQPYETWILPKAQEADFSRISAEQMHVLAGLIQRLIATLQVELPVLSYNLVLHTAPFQQECSHFYHWHLELIPRSTQLAGLEWGTGVHINPLSPERAAATLRESASFKNCRSQALRIQ